MSLPILLWDVDTQHDFIDSDGNLAVPGAEGIVSNLARLTNSAVKKGVPILGSADAHAPDDDEFEQFPAHCVADTPGQRKISATSPDGARVVQSDQLDRQLKALRNGDIPQLIIEKQELDVFSEPVAERVLSELAPEQIVLYGVATEFCVRLSVVGMLERDYRVTVVEDAIAAVDENEGRKAISEMCELGAEFTNTRSALEFLK